MHFIIHYLVLIVGLCSCCLAGAENTLSAGVARIDITPPLEMGATLGGYGERMNRPATGVHDRIFAKALVLSEGNDRFALVTLDALGVPPAFKPALIERLAPSGWRNDQVLLLPSHSHTSIEMNAINPKNRLPIPNLGLFHPELFEFILTRLTEVILEAAGQSVPVLVGTSSVQLPDGWVRNRRQDNVFTNPTLTVTRFDKVSGGPFAVLVNWAAHPTFTSALDMEFSGEWPGHLQRGLEALIGSEVTVLFYNGAEGDQSPRARPGSSDTSWGKMERYGRDLAIEAHQVWTTITPQPLPGFSYRLEEIFLPHRTWHPDFMATGGAEYGLREELMADILEELAPPQTTSVSLRLGDLLLVGIPGELTAQPAKDLCDKLSAATGAKFVTIGGLANEWISYILSPEEYTRGGYEASVSFYGPTLATVILEGAEKGVLALK